MKRRTLSIHRLGRFGRDEKGGTLAELAILFPLLALMLAAVSEFGRYFQTYTTLAKSTRTAARYISNHPYNATEITRATNLVVCGKLVCAGGDELVPGMTPGKVCIESTGSPKIQTVTVRIPHVAAGCGAPHVYQPIFDIGALLHNPTFSLAIPINPSTTMYYMLE